MPNPEPIHVPADIANGVFHVEHYLCPICGSALDLSPDPDHSNDMLASRKFTCVSGDNYSYTD